MHLQHTQLFIGVNSVTHVADRTISADERKGGAGANYRRPAFWNGVRGPTMLHMLLSFYEVLLFAECTN